MKYIKFYTRENTLFSIQVWEEHQGRRVKKYLDENAPISIFDVYGGVARVYYIENIADKWHEMIARKVTSAPKVIEDLMDLYVEQIDKLEKVWEKKIFDTKEELIEFFDFMADMWIGVGVSYGLPETNVSKKYQDLGMSLRQRSVDFLDNTDRVILASLKKFYPELGDLVKYLSIKEIKGDEPISIDELKKRELHYVYFGFEILTNVDDIFEFARQHGKEIIKEKIPENLKELKGQIAMKGKVSGRVRILHSKAMIKDLLDGEILVTAMTTPDYLPAMHRAIAFITDEGGITCHAAIVAREMGKPCIIGTKIATEALKDGDLVEVDADNGIVRLIK